MTNPIENRPCAPLLPADDRLADLWRQDAQICLFGPDSELAEANSASAALITQIAGIIYAAPHLHTSIKRIAKTHSHDIQTALSGNVSAILEEAQDIFATQLSGATDDIAVMVMIRHFRQRCYLALSLAELAGAITLKNQCAHLSDCAQFALTHCLRYLCRKAQIDERSLVILGMGKLGARELNYSSDIDLIILYDEAMAGARGADYVALTRTLIQICQKQTSDGFAWRVDLRLRPDPGATAIALSCGAAISYYESIARSWERAVFIRARPVAGNLALGETFLAAITPFIWRRQLDYTILSDLTAWITHYPMEDKGYGYDVKRGAYGIRHIEMMTHLLQLLHGGRDISLRSPHTDNALIALTAAGHLTDTQDAQSRACYWAWRQLEHRLQYCRDAHIYHLPHNSEDMTQFARFAGFPDATALMAYITSLQEATKAAASHRVILDMIAAHEGEIAKGAWPADETSQRQFLTEKGFIRADDTIRTIEGWMSGRLPATRSERARQTLQNLLPIVIGELAKGDNLDDHFMGFAQFLEALPAGVQVFSLLYQHPQLIELISHFTLNAPSLMRELTKNPQIFEQMLGEAFHAPLSHHPDFSVMLESIDKTKAAELQLDAIRLMAREAKFRAEAHIITYPHRATDAHLYLSELADACLHASFAVTISEFEAQYGTVENSHFAILLLGRAGQKRLTPQSDIDMIILYEGDRHSQSNGAKQLSCGHYYQRLAQRLISWTSAQTASGSLYEIDTRLRPDGNAGPIATHFAQWDAYLKHKAWPFEKRALQKARLLPFSGTSAAFADKITTLITYHRNAPIARDDLIKDIILLREKLTAEPRAPWDFKKRPGGLIDCEFHSWLDASAETQTAALWNHLSLMTSVMMPKSTRTTTPPASFEKELCRIMKQSSYEDAIAAMEACFDHKAASLEAALAL